MCRDVLCRKYPCLATQCRCWLRQPQKLSESPWSICQRTAKPQLCFCKPYCNMMRLPVAELTGQSRGHQDIRRVGKEKSARRSACQQAAHQAGSLAFSAHLRAMRLLVVTVPSLPEQNPPTCSPSAAELKHSHMSLLMTGEEAQCTGGVTGHTKPAPNLCEH